MGRSTSDPLLTGHDLALIELGFAVEVSCSCCGQAGVVSCQLRRSSWYGSIPKPSFRFWLCWPIIARITVLSSLLCCIAFGRGEELLYSTLDVV